MNDKLDNQDSIVFRAAEIKKQIKQLEDEYDLLALQVIARVKELAQDKDKYVLQVGEEGKFSVIQKRKYEYSADTQAAERNLKETKKEEEANGTAKIVEVTEYLQYRTITNDTRPRNQSGTL